MIQTFKDHPVIYGTVSGSIVIGLFAATLFGPESWGLTKSIWAGLIGGAGVGLMITATRMTAQISEDALTELEE